MMRSRCSRVGQSPDALPSQGPAHDDRVWARAPLCRPACPGGRDKWISRCCSVESWCAARVFTSTSAPGLAIGQAKPLSQYTKCTARLGGGKARCPITAAVRSSCACACVRMEVPPRSVPLICGCARDSLSQRRRRSRAWTGLGLTRGGRQHPYESDRASRVQRLLHCETLDGRFGTRLHARLSASNEDVIMSRNAVRSPRGWGVTRRWACHSEPCVTVSALTTGAGLAKCCVLLDELDHEAGDVLAGGSFDPGKPWR